MVFIFCRRLPCEPHEYFAMCRSTLVLVNLHHLLNTITVLAEMTRIGVDFCIDVHGDEALPYNFLSGSEGVGKWGPRLKHLQDKFAKSFRQVLQENVS